MPPLPANSPGRPTTLPGRSGAFLNPFAQTLETRAVNVRDAWDLIGTQITSLTDDPENYITIMRTLGENPAALLTGIPAAMLPGMEDLADANGLVRVAGPGSLGNREIAATMPIIAYGSPFFAHTARNMEADLNRALAAGDPNPLSPEGFKENYWNRSIMETATQLLRRRH